MSLFHRGIERVHIDVHNLAQTKIGLVLCNHFDKHHDTSQPPRMRHITTLRCYSLADEISRSQRSSQSAAR